MSPDNDMKLRDEEMGDDNESIRSSNIRSSGSPIMNKYTGEGQGNEKHVIMERKDKFIIFKMVVSISQQ